jgi:uridine kinase
MSSVKSQCRVIFIGIAGPSGCGKTTYAHHLIAYLHSPLNPIGLDDFCTRSILVDHPILGRIHSLEEPQTLDTARLIDLLTQIRIDPTCRTKYHRSTVSMKDCPSIEVVVVEGFLLFALSTKLTDLFDLRIFIESSHEQCRRQRYQREKDLTKWPIEQHGNKSQSFQKWFDHLVWPSYLKWRDMQMFHADKSFNFNSHDNYEQEKQHKQVDDYIVQRLKTDFMFSL